MIALSLSAVAGIALQAWGGASADGEPWAYLFIAPSDSFVARLREEGAAPEELREDIELDAREFGSRDPVAGRRIPAGAVLVRTREGRGAKAARAIEADAGRSGARVLSIPAEVPLTTCPVRPPPGDRKRGQPITFERLFISGDPPRLGGSPVGGLRWLADGESFLQVKGGRLWKVEAATGRASPFVDAGVLAEALARLPSIDGGTARAIAGSTWFHLSPREDAFIFEHGDDLYHAALDGKSAGRLTSSVGREEDASFSPDGNWVAFVRENDLHVVEVASRSERALTSGGTDKVRNGKNDWVYYEEVFDRSWKAYWWSPDSTRIAFLRIDSTPVKEFTIADDLEGRQEVERTPYPKPGEANPEVSVDIVRASGGPIAAVDLSDYDPGAFLVTGVGFSADGETLWLYVQDRVQRWLDLLAVGAGGGKPRKLLRESYGSWVDPPPSPPSFLEDGGFVLASERTGWRHLYRFSKDGKAPARITSGEWEVRRVEAVDEKGGWVYFTGTRDDPIAENFYRAKLDGSSIERLTAEPGSHSIAAAPGSRAFIDSWSSLRCPTRVALRRSDGSPVRTLDTNPVHALEEWRLSPVEHVRLETADGFLLEALLLRPPDFDPGRRYPVWCSTYAGPRTPSVRDAWEGGRTWDQMLVGSGIVVFHVDPRSASGKGAVSAWTAYRRLGIPELQDLEEAARWLASKSWVDPGRIGLSGVSYGGFMAAFALTRSKLFSAAIAGAPPTDWRDYDSIYTERYMDTPQANPEGYDATSVVKGARDLHGRLLIIHGLIDDNVHVQNTWRLVDELVKADRDFEMLIYPGPRHGFWSLHYRRTMFDFIRKTMRPLSARL